MKAEKIWHRMNYQEHRQAYIGLSLWKQTYQWQQSLKNDGGLYIPHASTFLQQRRWAEEPWTGAFAEKHA